MINTFTTFIKKQFSHSPWDSTAPIREELFGLERLEEHAASLAKAQKVSKSAPSVSSLHIRLDNNSIALLKCYRESANEIKAGRSVVPAAEWLLDNYHLVEEQIREVKDDLPVGYYRQLPKLTSGPFAGYPRVFGLVWAYVAHTDSHFDPDILIRFIIAYQKIQPLTIGELWAVAITLRIILIENLRRLADQISAGRAERFDADRLAEQLLLPGAEHSALKEDVATRSVAPLSEIFAAQLAKRFRDQDPQTTPALEWLEKRLKAQGLTVEEVVQHAQQRQGASNVSIRNVIVSMRLISDIDWADLFEQVSLVDEQLRLNSLFVTMDFPTRNLYRSAIEQLARGCHLSEVEIAEKAVAMAQTDVTGQNEQTDRLSDPGYYLIDRGRREFEKSIHFKPTFALKIRRFHIKLGVGGYVGTLTVVALAYLALALLFPAFANLPGEWLALWMLIGFIPASEVACAIVNRLVSWRFGAMILPGLDLKAGVPTPLRTLIAVPTLLTSKADLLAQIERLEVHFLSGIDGDVSFALLTDGVDADQEELPDDAALLALATSEIERLNHRYPETPGGARFLLLHRKRLYNPSEKVWMGWERKRGKLHELNQLLRGATNTSFIGINGNPPWVPDDVRYVITLDADTRLPREAALRLIGKMAHPLNCPQLDHTTQRVIAGYGILQPRVTPSLSIGNEGSFYQQVFSAPGGIDPYSSAASDVYQDLFAEGSFTGKGIYHVDAFVAALENRVAENTILSHDLFEGIFARAGLVSDVEVIEEFPARYDVAAKRQDRWTRGDWQLLPWAFKKRFDNAAATSLGRWKIIDNLRRSLAAPMTLLALMLSWLLPPPFALLASGFILSTIAIPAFIPCLFSLIPHRKGVDNRHHFRSWLGDLRLAISQTALSIAFLPDQSWRVLKAVSITLVRLWVTHRHLLEWTTAARSASAPRLDGSGFYRTMAGSVLLGLFACLVPVMINQYFATPIIWFVIVPLAILWCLAPVLALYASRSLTRPLLNDTDANAKFLRLTARKTWRFFETFVTSSENMLPPDNFQEEPEPVVAHRTSPTNIGLYLLSAASAHDFGWAGLVETLERFEATFTTLNKMRKYKGHLFNWYATETLEVLNPEYISSVDSGNLAGHLIALANTCDEWRLSALTENPEYLSKAITIRSGLRDNLDLAQDALALITSGSSHPLSSVLYEIGDQLNNLQTFEAIEPILLRLIRKAITLAQELPKNDLSADCIFWIDAIYKVMLEQQRDRQEHSNALNALAERLDLIASSARDMAMAMNFTFLIDPERKLLSIGYALNENKLDSSCYDLLASEARLASLFAIAKGDVVTKHWFRLGRTAKSFGHGSALISWSGSMFEYLMPSLVMRAPAGSLLEQTNRIVVQHQQSYAEQLGIPWGISESAYNARDIEFTYQYSNFGVPKLGLKRGLAEDRVIAPYATALAAMIDPQAAVQNLNRLAKMGAAGRYGFYEALDFTSSRVPEGKKVAIIHNFMAHHQGMTIVAINNILHEGLVRQRFHEEPMIKACELLLQERMPRDVSINHPEVEEFKAPVSNSLKEQPAVRKLNAMADGTPITHLLSNGRYTVMLTATGAGYSRWRDIAVTRWQEDPVCDQYGTFIFLRDIKNGHLWSTGAQPFGHEGHYSLGSFEEDHAKFTHNNGSLTTTTDILVSGEDDGEVRHVTLTNHGRKSHHIELTSYIELVLTTADADNAHPAFAKMFVQTEYVSEYGALIANRRKRSAHDPEIWAAHFATVEGEVTADLQYESNRALFIGRGNSLKNAAALHHKQSMHTESAQDFSSPALSNTVGTVLDPIFSLRYRVKVKAGGIVHLSFWTVIASSRQELLDLIDRHHDRSSYDRAKTLSWTQAQVQLRHLAISSGEAADFQRLAAPLIYADPRFRATPQVILRGLDCQSELWRHSISGDLPIVLLHIDDVQDIEQVKQLLRAHEYWRMKRIAVDLVIVNEHASSYRQELQIAIETAVRISQSRARINDEPGREQVKGQVHILRADLISIQARELLKSVARVVLVARRGSIRKYLERLPQSKILEQPAEYKARSNNTVNAQESLFDTKVSQLKQKLEFFNGLGGFGENGREYTIILEKGACTPAPWINVISNPDFGFHVAAEGSAYTWAENSRENKLTSWCNDPVSNPSGEAIYVRDEETLDIFGATAQPVKNSIQTASAFIAYHGRGYSRFEHQSNGIELSLLQYVPLTDPIKISRLTLHNRSGRPRKLSVTSYTEWVLGISRTATAPFLTSETDADLNALLVHNRWSIAFPGRVAFTSMAGRKNTWTTDRTEFLGRHGNMAAPLALQSKNPLSGAVGTGFDPCTAQQCTLELAADESVEIVVFIGQCASALQAKALLQKYSEANLEDSLEEVKHYWQELLGAVQVKTPDRAMDIMLNGWLMYQSLACRIWARSAFYQASGAYGFRDQLQDGMSLTFRRPDLTREHILRAASRQFIEGDVQHWWLPQTGQGVRTHISDDRVWLVFATATYIQTSGDHSILDEIVPFIEGPPLPAEQHDAFFQPMIADESATLFEHCARALNQCIELTGQYGLPLMGTGDWNDGMNRVGEGGQGESVWLGWLLIHTIEIFTPMIEHSEQVQRWKDHGNAVKAAIEKNAWDGEWYRRASFDDGSWLGSQESDECQIDSIAQSWAVLSGAADPERAAIAMNSLEQKLIRPQLQLALLFTPPFDRTSHNPGYIKGYPPGLRENGGQYTHAAMWTLFAFTRLGEAQKAHDLFAMLNPINHARNLQEANRYKVEPYVMPADIYSVEPNAGHGGWTWYTGAAGWMYRAGMEGILGLQRRGSELIIQPCIPADWPGFEASVRLGATNYTIIIEQFLKNNKETSSAKLDGVDLLLTDTTIRVPIDGQSHQLNIILYVQN